MSVKFAPPPQSIMGQVWASFFSLLRDHQHTTMPSRVLVRGRQRNKETRPGLCVIYSHSAPEPSLKYVTTPMRKHGGAHTHTHSHSSPSISSTAPHEAGARATISPWTGLDWRTARIPYGYASLHHPTLSLPTNPKNYGHFLVSARPLVFPIRSWLQAGESRWAMRSLEQLCSR